MPVSEEAGEGVDIKVLGQGCPQCDRLEQELMAIISETGIPAMIEHVRDVEEIAQFGLMRVPALVINGKIKASGSVPPKAKMKDWIQQAAEQK
jgi:small redox-active disulfide protein 2